GDDLVALLFLIRGLGLVLIADGAGLAVLMPAVTFPVQGGVAYSVGDGGGSAGFAGGQSHPGQGGGAQFEITLVNLRVQGVPENVDEAVEKLEARCQAGEA